MMKNTNTSYGFIARAFHWIIAALIFALIPLGFYMHRLPFGSEAEIAEKVQLYSVHKTIGVLVFLLALMRVFWALINPKPVALHPERKLETGLAELIHGALYLSILAVPLFGWMHHAASTGFAPILWPFGQNLPLIPKSEALSEIFGALHAIAAFALIGSLALHIAGGLKHWLIDRDQTIARMLTGAKAGGKKEKGSYLPFAAGVLLLGLVYAGGSFITASKSQEAQSPEAQDALVEAEGGNWSVNQEKSALKFTFMQLGSEVEGVFKDWQAMISFDPDDLSTAKVMVKIAMHSLDVGAVTDQAKSSDFLNVEAFPEAVFTADEFHKREDNRYEARGELELHGEKKPLTLVFDLEIKDDHAQMTGEAEIMRLDFGVGSEGFATDEQVGFAVIVKPYLEAMRKR